MTTPVPFIRLGLQIPRFEDPSEPRDQLFEHVADIARTAEESGFDSVWVMDHFLQIPNVGPKQEPMFEAYTLLGALAARTARVRLGAMVTGVTYRSPGILAKQVTTLDVISGGRAVLGIGAAWYDDEHKALGVDFPPAGERLDRLEEALQICRLMFTEDAPSFEGRYSRIHEAINLPRPIQPGGPPILIGGGGERRTLRLVAMYADACNIFGDVPTVRRKLDVLERHCESVGRDPASITKTRLGTLLVSPTNEGAERELARLLPQVTRDGAVSSGIIVGDPDEVVQQAQEYLDAGLDGLVFNMPNVHDLAAVSLAGTALSVAIAGVGKRVDG